MLVTANRVTSTTKFSIARATLGGCSALAVHRLEVDNESLDHRPHVLLIREPRMHDSPAEDPISNSCGKHRARKVIWASALVVLTLSAVTFLEQGYRFYRVTQADIASPSGPLPPGFNAQIQDLQSSFGKAKVARLHDLQVILMVLSGLLATSAVVCFLARRPKVKAGDPPLAPVRLGRLWVIPLGVVPLTLLVVPNLIFTAYEWLFRDQPPAVASSQRPNDPADSTMDARSDAPPSALPESTDGQQSPPDSSDREASSAANMAEDETARAGSAGAAPTG